MSSTIKTTRNTIKLGGKTYYSFAYLKNSNKSFDRAEFIVVNNLSYYLLKEL
jgi:hypothetical protein